MEILRKSYRWQRDKIVIGILCASVVAYEKVLETLGAVDTEVFSRLLRQILDKNVTGAIQVIDG